MQTEIHAHDRLLAIISQLPDRLSKHEEREDIILGKIHDKLTQMQVDIATIRKNTNGKTQVMK